MALDPVLQQIVAQLPLPTSDKIDHEVMRRDMEALIPLFYGPDGPIDAASVENVAIDGEDGPVPLRIIRPLAAPTGTLHLLHGGGWAFGSIEFIEPLARRLARNLSMVVVASGYRLAPENPFPAGFNDCLAAARWTIEHAAELGGAGNPVVIAGESAGANLATAVALEFAGTGSENFDAQLLFFPAVDLRKESANYPSRIANADPTLRTGTLPQMMKDYCGEHDPADPRLSPITSERLDAAPPAVIVVLEVDPLRDEAVAYTDRLREAGVDVELVEFDNLTHGFPNLSALVPAAAEATELVGQHLKTLLARSAAG
ncbi:putative lipase LipH [Sphingobium sp. TomTYG75]